MRNVFSEPTKPVPNNKVIDWLTVNEGNLVVDAIVVGELCVGILALPVDVSGHNPEQWFRDVVQTIDCLPWDATICRRWAKLVVNLKQKGDKLPLLDGMIAATALTVAARNPRDFRSAGAKVLNTFS